jgi:hypothetical protein
VKVSESSSPDYVEDAEIKAAIAATRAKKDAAKISAPPPEEDEDMVRAA